MTDLRKQSARRRMLGLALLLAAASFLPLAISPAGPAQAGPGTDVFFAPAGRVNPNETVVAFINGPAVGVDVRVRNVTYPTGLGAFQFDMTYSTSVAGLLTVVEGPFLGSSQRDTQCLTSPLSSPGFLSYSCNSLTNTPNGPQGSGVLATLTFQPGSSFGFTPLTFTKTHLDDITGDVPIPHTEINGNLLVAKCGDFSADNIVSIGDMVQLISRFGTFNGSANWDPRFDLNVDDRITVGDMLIEVQEFGRGCVAS